MKPLLSFSHLFPFSFLSLLLFTCSYATHSGFSSQDFFANNAATRVGFVNTTTQEQTIVLVQENGIIDYYSTFMLVLPPSVSEDDITFTQSSDNERVLNVSAGGNIASMTHSPGVLNCSVSLAFDGMAGKSKYTLLAVRKVTQEVVDTIAINFIIVGMTFYREGPSGTAEVVSGDGNHLSISYEDALNNTASSEISLKVMIQYSDGTNSDTFTGGVIPNGDSMLLELSGDTGQIVHNSGTCSVNSIGTVNNATGELELPASCGCGFYYTNSSLHFGCAFEPYRTGAFSIHFSWPGVTVGFLQLQNEALDLTLKMDIIGKPPVALVAIEPSTELLRPDGGEIRTVKILNIESHRADSFQIRVDTISKPFAMIPGTYQRPHAPDFHHSVSLLTQPGVGIDLNWSLYYQRVEVSGNKSTVVYEKAAFAPTLKHSFSYDTKKLKIDRIDPEFGSEDGGENVTISGYFPNFNGSRDGIYITGYKLEQKYISSVSDEKIVFTLPPRRSLGSSYEYDVSIKIGFSTSNTMKLSFDLVDATVSVTYTGASALTDGAFQIGECSKPRFTAMVAPASSQLLSFQWGLYFNGEMNESLLETPAYSTVDSTAQTLELDSSFMKTGMYSLKVVVKLMKTVVESEIILMRQNVVAIGASILPNPNRTITNPDVPLRFTAVVDPLGACHPENMTERLLFEWEGFGSTVQFSSDSEASVSNVGPVQVSVGRLGWEFVIPQDSLSLGAHEVSFKTWLKGNASVAGQAFAKIFIEQSPLVAVIRSGERQVSLNYFSKLRLTAENSYDPDVLGDSRFDNLSYLWSCRQSSSLNFSDESSSPCIPALIPDAAPREFEIPMNIGEAVPDVRFLEYVLITSKESGRVVGQTSLIVEIENSGKLPFLDSYNVSLTGADGVIIDWNKVPYYEDIVLSVTSSFNSTWEYELIEPVDLSFFSSFNLVDHPSYYEPSSNVSSVSDNQKPLGIRAKVLNPFTTYYIKISFASNKDHEATQVTVALRTIEASAVTTPTLSSTQGTTSSYFTAVTASTTVTTVQSFYFMVTDVQGNDICAGGCTGHQISHFRIKRSGTYTVSSHMVDCQGKALLSSVQATSNLTVTETVVEGPNGTAVPSVTSVESLYQNLLDKYFATGNDQCWTQMAQDVVIAMMNDNVQSLSGTARGGLAREARLASQMDIATNLANDSTRIFCNSYPNTYYGRDCVQLLHRISNLRLIDVDAVYFLMQSASCCIKNTPARTIKKVIPWLPRLITQLNRQTRNIKQEGNSRRRLLQTVGEPANAVADVILWTSDIMAEASTSGKLEGFTGQYNVGDEEAVGHVSVAVASNLEHLPMSVVNGVSRNVLKGLSDNEIFYPREVCLSHLFKKRRSRRRIVMLQTTDNFLLLGFQGPPLRSNLVDRLYWTKVYDIDEYGRVDELAVRQDGYCYCWRLPVNRLRTELASSVEDMPGLFEVNSIKKFGEDVLKRGDKFKYVYDGSKTSEYNATQGWVEGCRIDVGLVSSTIVAKKASNVVAYGGVIILGLSGLAFVGLVITGLLLVVVAVVVSWLVAVRAMGGEETVAVGDGDVFVERDVYGRSTAIDANIARMQSGD